MTVDVEYARANFEKLLNDLEHGDYIELVREGKPTMRFLLGSSIASQSFAENVARYLTVNIPPHADQRAKRNFAERNNISLDQVTADDARTELFRCTPWTTAVHDCLRSFAHDRRWKLLPDDRPFKGEYLCDFMLLEEGYGCRIACESQWDHGGNHAGELDWAFDKLRGVKADLKVFIYEGRREQTEAMICNYLENSFQNSKDEAYLCLRWQQPSFEASFYQRSSPERSAVKFRLLFTEQLIEVSTLTGDR